MKIENMKFAVLFLFCWMTSFTDARIFNFIDQDGVFPHFPNFFDNPIIKIINATNNASTSSDGRNRTESFFDSFFLDDPLRGLMSIVNTTSRRAIALDPSLSLTSIFDGINGSAIIYNFRNNSGVFLPGLFQSTWNSTSENWPEFFYNVSLSELYNQGVRNGTFFTIFNVTKRIVDEVSNVTSNWTAEFSRTFQNSDPDPLQTLTNVSVALSGLYNGTIRNFFSRIESRMIPITNLLRLVNFFRGMSTFYGWIRGGIDNLRNGNFSFDPTPFFRARNGIEALVALFRALQFSYDLNELLNEYFNSEENMLRLIALLGGNVCTGVTGFIRAMYEQMTLGYPVCASPIGNFLGNFGGPLANEWRESVTALYDVTRNLGAELGGLRRFARFLREGRNNIGRSP